MSSSLQHRSVASAHLLHDQLRIFLKIINTATQEADIYRYLRLGDRSIAEDPLNKTIPMLDILLLPVPGRAVVVMYEWSEVWFYPSVVTWAQYKGFMRETLEVGLQSRIQFVPGGQYLEMLNIQGLAFMHSHLIAHLDITNGNILTGPPGCDFSSPSARHYAYVDFQYSVRFPRDHKGPMTVVGAIATEPAPEQNDLVPYDPFCTDVWQLGRLFESDVEVGHSFPLIADAPARLNKLHTGSRTPAEATSRAPSGSNDSRVARATSDSRRGASVLPRTHRAL